MNSVTDALIQAAARHERHREDSSNVPTPSTPPLRDITLRLSVTDACQMRCLYCRPRLKKADAPVRPPLPKERLAALIEQIHRIAPVSKLRITGGEPLLQQHLPEIIAACAAIGVGEIAMTTNAQRLAARAEEVKRAGLDRVNISLDSLDSDIFAIINGGDLAASLAGVEAALRCDLRPVKLNMVVLRNYNDHEVGEMLAFALHTGCQIRFLELMPIDIGEGAFRRAFVSWDEVFEKIKSDFEALPMPTKPGATSRDFLVRDRHNRTTLCGFISPSSHPFCEGCNRLRLTCDGRLLGCLGQRHSLDLLPALEASLAGDQRRLKAALTQSLAQKCAPHNLANQRGMARIGG